MFEAFPGSVRSVRLCARLRCWIGTAALAFAAFAAFASAAQVDISESAVFFGTQVVVLANGNFVATAPGSKGAVFLYGPDGTLISALRGSVSTDNIGSGGVTVVGGGSNFVVSSPGWNGVGAATWVDGAIGLDGAVSDGNSLVGTTAGDAVSGSGVVALSNGNYVVLSASWSSGVSGATFGAATFGSGSAGVKGNVSSTNSLVGTTNTDQVGSAATALTNGNYVVRSPNWSGVGAATWGSGTSGVAGPVSSSNSLVGTAQGDAVGGGGVTALANGNYVVQSPSWNGGVPASHVGAVTLGSGSAGVKDVVSVDNSLMGTTAGDQVGSGGITVVGAGANFVVSSPGWSGVGAATWVDGASGLHAAVSGGNSLVGTTANDAVSGGGIALLSNGNYVVLSPNWNNAVADAKFGAATFGSGNAGVKGAVSSGNSLIGTMSNDQVGSAVAALKNGNYVVSSPNWNGQVGAATWGSGNGGIAGAVSAGNSLIGTDAGDSVGANVVALSNGNYVVESPGWNAGRGAATRGNGSTGLVGSVSAATSLTGAIGDAVAGNAGLALANGNYVAMTPDWQGSVGAATLLAGSGSFSGTVSAANSLTGSNGGDVVGVSGVTLGNGNYVVSSNFRNGTPYNFGAVTWSGGTHGSVGAVSAKNSLVGENPDDFSQSSIQDTSDGNYIVFCPFRDGPEGVSLGSVTLANGAFRLKGTIQPWNSVLGLHAGGGSRIVFAYNAPYRTLIVGRPAENIVSLFTMDQVFAGDFD